jgi:hypothetical protein
MSRMKGENIALTVHGPDGYNWVGATGAMAPGGGRQQEGQSRGRDSTLGHIEAM